jgi:isopentenyl diphosphate isomerase/L-lactate dehydrogenase-like FMN-dependent dehydrogenase
MFYALAVGGEAGVEHMLDLLRLELEAAMRLCGVQDVGCVPGELVTHKYQYNEQRSRL